MGSVVLNKNVSKTAVSPLKIGDLLVSEGYAKVKDIEKALKQQEEEKKSAKLPLGKLLVKLGYISEDDLEEALNHPNLRKNIGSLAIEKGYITKDELAEALNKKLPGQMIGEVLVKLGMLSNDDLGNLLKEQISSPKIGHVLVDLKLITENDLQNALRRQKITRTLGEILCEMNVVSIYDLNYVLEKYNKQGEISDILLRLGFISDSIVNEAKREQAGTSESLEKIMLRKKFITSEQLQIAYSKRYNLPYMPLNDFSYNPSEKNELVNVIKQKYAEKNLVLPVSLMNKELQVAICRPIKHNFIDELRSLYPNLSISCCFITEEKFDELFELLYSKKIKLDESEVDDTEETMDVNFMDFEFDETLADDDDKPYARGYQDMEAEEVVNYIIKYGIVHNASDIHIEQDRKGPKLRFRIDGVLEETKIDWLRRRIKEKAGAIISRIKVMSNLDIAEKRLPQDGVFRINFYDTAKKDKFDIDFRVATCRAIVGENVTIRILDSRKANVGLENLQHSPHVLDPMKRLLKSSAGMVLVSGPTGSGKSSTLYGALLHVYSPGVKIITAEDPIEYSFPGIMQTQIQPKIGITFPRLLRSFLRSDPDIILVGEMRDSETAQIGFDAAQTGHLLLSTIHTNDSISAVSRLLDLEIDHAQIASCLLAVVAQRLLRKICPFCKKEYIPSEDEWRVIFDSYPSHLNFFQGAGCESCNFTGYKGRTLISEIFVIDKEISAAISERSSESEIKKIAIESGMKSMLEDGLMKLNDTTLGELIRVIPHDLIKTFKSQKKVQNDLNDLMDNLFDGSGKKATESMTVQSFIISNPDKQLDTIEQMLEKYNFINKAVNKKYKEAKLNMFSEFIKENFSIITEKYNCSKVCFDISSNKGAAEITAVGDN